MDTSILTALATTLASAFAAIILNLIKSLTDKKRRDSEEKELKDEVEGVLTKFVKVSDEKNDDVLSLMIKNVAELREYYVINKQQARNSFSAALFICILGFLIFASGIVLTYYSSSSDSVIQYTTIGGTIVEVIAGLFFWLYSKAIRQINLFHSSLLGTQKFLTAIQLVDEIGEQNRDQVYTYIIKKIIDEKEKVDISLVTDMSTDNGTTRTENSTKKNVI